MWRSHGSESMVGTVLGGQGVLLLQHAVGTELAGEMVPAAWWCTTHGDALAGQTPLLLCAECNRSYACDARCKLPWAHTCRCYAGRTSKARIAQLSVECCLPAALRCFAKCP
jgi:hypothetical protein